MYQKAGTTMKEQLSTWRWAIGGVLLSSSLSLGIWGLSTTAAQAERGAYVHSGDDKESDNEQFLFRIKASEANALYVEECGSCHLAYPPGLLPPQSWEQIMGNLDNHFGDNAELEPEDKQKIQNYLLNYATGRYNNGMLSNFVGSNVDSAVPTRITELRYFLKEHDEIPQRLVTANKEVGSFSQCDACHTKAGEGRFDEDEVSIPGHGRWDD